jgi:hypothetical protein
MRLIDSSIVNTDALGQLFGGRPATDLNQRYLPDGGIIGNRRKRYKRRCEKRKTRSVIQIRMVGSPLILIIRLPRDTSTRTVSSIDKPEVCYNPICCPSTTHLRSEWRAWIWGPIMPQLNGISHSQSLNIPAIRHQDV